MLKGYFEDGTEYDPSDSVLITDQGPAPKASLIRRLDVSVGHVVVRIACPHEDDSLLGRKIVVQGQDRRASLYVLLNKFYDAIGDAYLAKVPQKLQGPKAATELYILEANSNDLPLFKNSVVSVETDVAFDVPRFAFNRKDEIRLTEREKAYKAIRDLREIV